MAIRTYDILLDSYNSTIPEPIVGRQGDKNGAVTLHVTITDRGTAVDLTGQTVNLIAETAKGTAVVADNAGVTLTDAKNGRFDYAIPNALWSEAGKITKAYFSLNDSNGQQTTYDLFFIVKIAADMTKESAKDWVSNLNEIIEQYNQWANDAHSSWQNFVDSNKEIIESIDPGGALLTEVIDARKPDGKDPYESLGERLNLEHNSNMIDEKLVSGGFVKDYFEPEIARVKGNLTDGLFTFGQMNDSHYEKITRVRKNAILSLNHVKNLLAFSDVADLLLLNGDNNNSDNYSLDEVKQDIETMTDVLFDEIIDGKADRFIQIGNHDDGSTRRLYAKPYRFLAQNDYLHEDYFKSMYRTSNSQGEVRNGDSLYFYKDYDDKKIRFISLYTEDIVENMLDSDGSQKYGRWLTHVIRQEQANWLANVALMNIPEGYHVVVTGHCPPNVNEPGGITDTGAKYLNWDIIRNVLVAFKNGTNYTGVGKNDDFPLAISCNYTSQGPRPLVGYFSGHTHRDATSVLDGINVVEINHSFATDNLVGTAKEDAFALIQVDTAKRKAIINGFGNCKDREVPY